MAENLPRVPDPMTGLWPRSMFNIAYLQVPVADDQIAEIILSEVAGLEQAKARVQMWAAEMVKRYDSALTVIAESAAIKSLPAYVKATTGKKTLALPSATIKVRTQKDVLQVYDEKLAKINCPEAVYAYQAPPAEKLNREKLREYIKAHGPLVVEGDNGQVVIAEVKPEIETVKIDARPSGEVAGAAQPLRLPAAEMEETHEDHSAAE